MQLHSKGQQDHIRELQKQKALELEKIKDSSNPTDQKNTLIRRVIDKFKKRIRQSNDSLFLKIGQ